MKSKKQINRSEIRAKMNSGKNDRSWLSGAVCIVALAAFIATFRSIQIHENPFGKLPETLENIGESLTNVFYTTSGMSTTTSSFEEWFRMNGGKTENVVLHAFESMGNGVLATKDIAPKDRTLFVPKQIIICRDTIFKSIKDNKPLKRLLRKFYTDEELIAAFLLLVASVDDQWTPYFNVLPKQITSPIVFNEEELEELQDQHVIRTTRREIEQNKQRFQTFQHVLNKAGPTFQPKANEINLKDYLWAMFIINSRALSIEGKRLLVPYADMFNGQPHETKRQAKNGAHFLTYHRLNTSGMEILSDRFVPKGSQVFEDYGDNDNYIYFVHHGFVMQQNPFDCTFIQLTISSELDTKRSSILETFGIEYKEESNFNARVCITKDGQVNDARMKLLLNVLLWTTKQVDACLSNRKKCFEFSYGKKHDFKIQNFLQVEAKKQLQAYPSTTVKDLILLTEETNKLSPNVNKAIEFRLSRKFLLEEFLTIKQHKLLIDDDDDDVKQEEVNAAKTKVDTTTMNSQVKKEPVEVSPDSESDSESEEREAAAKVDRFNKWIKSLHFPINHLTLDYINPTFGYGTFASKDLSQGEIYVSVPSEAWMDIDSAYRSPVLKQLFHELYRKERTVRVHRDPTLELLVHLMYEKFIQKEKSFWFPYLEMLPSVSAADRSGSPLFYDEKNHMKLLSATDLFQSIDDYRARTKSMFEFVKIHIFEAFPQVFTEKLVFQDINHFKWAVAILDSRSIWWNGKRHLVPLLDMVNCFTLPKGSTVHSTFQEEQYAITKTGWTFHQGEQVVENYGQPNYIYLHYHGFVLKQNPHDCIHLKMDIQEPLDVTKRNQLIQKLQKFQVSSWTTEMCLSVYEDVQPFDMKKFKFLANVVMMQQKTESESESDTMESEEQLTQKNAKLFLQKRIQLLSKELELAELNKKELTTEIQDFRYEMILEYMSTQVQLMEKLFDKLLE